MVNSHLQPQTYGVGKNIASGFVEKHVRDLAIPATTVVDYIISTTVKSGGIDEILGLKHVTGARLKELKDLKQLKWLDLGITKLTDAGLKELKELKQLTTLSLFNAK
jgi:hypothetical protein